MRREILRSDYSYLFALVGEGVLGGESLEGSAMGGGGHTVCGRAR